MDRTVAPLADAPPADSSSTRWAPPVLAISGLSLVACVLYLGHKSFWFDEALTVRLGRLPAPELWRLLRAGGANLGLYYLFMHAWTTLGTGEVVSRLSSVLAAVATIPVVWALGRRLFGARAAWMSALVLAVHPYFVYSAQQARYYALMVFLSALASLLFVRAIDRTEFRPWAAYALVASFLIYAHAFGALVVGAHAVSLLLRPRRIPWRQLLLTGAFMVPLLVPFAVIVLTQGGFLTAWIPALSRVRILIVALDLAGGREPYGWALLALFGFLGAVGLVETARRRRAEPELPWRFGFAFLLAVLPLGASLVISLVRPVLVSRYLVGVLPGVALVAGFALSRLRLRALATGALCALLLCDLIGLNAVYRGRSIEDWRGAARYLASVTEPGDQVFVLTSWAIPGMRTQPLSLDYYVGRVRPAMRASVHSDRDLLAELDDAGGPTRLWIVTSDQTYAALRDQVVAALRAAGYRAVHPDRLIPTAFRPITITRYDRSG